MSDSTVTFDKPSYMCDEQAWVRALDYAMHAETTKVFKKRLEQWLPYFPDVVAALSTLKDENSWKDYQEFRRGMQSERDGIFAGEEWLKRWGAILLPANAMRATLLKDQFQVPWGAMLIRIAEVTT